MLEKRIENKLVKGVKIRGGIAFKFTSPGTSGVPDRLVCVPGGRLYLVELKSDTGRLGPLQRVIRQLLAKIGITVYVLHTFEQVDNFLKMIDDDL